MSDNATPATPNASGHAAREHRGYGEASIVPAPKTPPDLAAAADLLAGVMSDEPSAPPATAEVASESADAPAEAPEPQDEPAKADGDEPTADAQAVEAEPEPEPEPEPPDGAAMANASEPEPDPEPVKPEPREPIEPWKRAMQARRDRQLRQREQKIAADMRALEDRARAIEERDRAISEQARVLETDPERALELLAQRLGQTPEEYYERVTKERIDKTKPEYIAQQAMAELQKMREQIAQERRDREHVETQRREAEKVRSYQSELSQNLQVITSIPDHQEWSQDFKYLSALPKDEIAKQAREVIETAGRSGIPMDLGDVARFLDKRAKNLVDSVQKRFAPLSTQHNEAHAAQSAQAHRGPEGTPAQAETLQRGQGNPATVAKPGKKPQPLVSSNRVAAETTGKRREATPEERMRQAGDILAGQLGVA